MKAIYLLCLVLTVAVVQGGRVKRAATEQSSEKREAFMNDLEKLRFFEKQFARDGQMHDKGLKAAQAVRDFLNVGKAWAAKKRGLKAAASSDDEKVGKRGAFMNDMQNAVLFEKQFSKKGELSPNEMKAAKAVREYREFAAAWQERKNAGEKRENLLSDLQKTIDFEKKFYPEGKLSQHERKAAKAVGDYLKSGKAWEAKKKGLKVQGSRSTEGGEEKRSSFLNNLKETLQFEKQFYKKGKMSPQESKVAKEAREFLKIGQAWEKKKGKN
ncbi:uncharacterized protein LOC118424839 [Branchiostoma floridae]|uniref:Uncharacterized protein LOC118424839 n=1 Tax=Branchiostoma floridae TaxID=7739 RepID=A0A9J7LVN1_BRAFL|nr:uncharacterized protein LOC118424839 [Branchiostoma floridae]